MPFIHFIPHSFVCSFIKQVFIMFCVCQTYDKAKKKKKSGSLSFLPSKMEIKILESVILISKENIWRQCNRKSSLGRVVEKATLRR